jgi:hypothetical protein
MLASIDKTGQGCQEKTPDTSNAGIFQDIAHPGYGLKVKTGGLFMLRYPEIQQESALPCNVQSIIIEYTLT